MHKWEDKFTKNIHSENQMRQSAVSRSDKQRDISALNAYDMCNRLSNNY